jgi:hypothetical protein
MSKEINSYEKNNSTIHFVALTVKRQTKVH